MVNDQLAQLYLDLEVEGLCTQLSLLDNIDDVEDSPLQISTMTMIYEENAIFPVTT